MPDPAPDTDDPKHAVGPELFISTIFRDAITPDRRVVIFGGDRSSKWCSTPKDAARAVKSFDVSGNAYMSCCLMRAAAKAPSKRGSAKDAVAMGALWVDVDVGTEGHTGKSYPPTIEEARDHLARRIEQPPSIILETGGGFHAWWLLDEPLIFETNTDRSAAVDLIRRWQQHIRDAWDEKGWSLDSTHDLARLMRIPGTHNHKHSPPVPAHVAIWEVC